ncbi:hypothetical protein [uncultured Anaerococcus sp.]|uniref:hypothetical protein n=1 Tax=uncultured Anaerococcus sp. TaxID=293428 RepID=UPI00288A9C0E|nr:hypothetical protein [uncultured Anaerococcus sp.]
MILTKFENGKKISYQVTGEYGFEEISQDQSQFEDCFCLEIENDPEGEKLKLLVILSPIFIAAFDNGNVELEFLKKTIKNSSYPFALYPDFFGDFDKKEYFKAYEDKDEGKITEDIILREDKIIEFYFNSLPEAYLKSLLAMVDGLIEDDSNRRNLLQYFDQMRDDIVINGRRSILANGIQAFYLNKYVVVWMLDLFSFIQKNKADVSSFLDPIMDLVNDLKTPANIK